MSAATPPPLPAELEALLRRMHLPYMRRAAPEVLATAKAQRWDPAEVLKVLLGEEVAGRERSALATRRTQAAFPTGKTFATWDQGLSSQSSTDPDGVAHAGMDWPAGESCDLWTLRYPVTLPLLVDVHRQI